MGDSVFTTPNRLEVLLSGRRLIVWHMQLPKNPPPFVVSFQGNYEKQDL